MFKPFTFDNLPECADIPNEFGEASIDPAFDAEMEDVEYHLAQFRRDFNME